MQREKLFQVHYEVLLSWPDPAAPETLSPPCNLKKEEERAHMSGGIKVYLEAQQFSQRETL